MQIRIDSALLGKTGKSFAIKMGDKTFYAKPDQGIQSYVGKTIEAEIEPSTFNGKDGQPVTLQWIKAFKVLAGSAPAAAQSNGGAAQSSGEFMRLMPFVSNVCAHAIQCGKIESPADIGKWAKGAYEAAIALEAIAEFRGEMQ